MQTLKIKLRFALGIFFVLTALLAPATALADNCNTSATPTGNVAKPSEIQNCLKSNKIVTDLNNIVDFLSAGVGVVVTGVILLGGIQYILAGDNATAVTAARNRITNGLIALVTFLFIYAVLQWLIPGGAFG